MYERWTDRARKAVVLAQEQVRISGHLEAGTGHLLLGLLAEDDNVAKRALEALDVSYASARAALAGCHPAGKNAPAGHIPFSRQAMKACEYALREALQLGCNYIGAEHVLLGLLRDEDCTAVAVLSHLAVRPETVRAKVLELLRGYEEAKRAKAAPPRTLSPCTRCDGSGSEPQHPPTPASLTDRLAVTVADLDAHIERRAAQIALPAVEAAERERQASAQRLPDLQREHGRQVLALANRISGLEAELSGLREALRRQEGNPDA